MLVKIIHSDAPDTDIELRVMRVDYDYFMSFGFVNDNKSVELFRIGKDQAKSLVEEMQKWLADWEQIEST